MIKRTKKFTKNCPRANMNFCAMDDQKIGQWMTFWTMAFGCKISLHYITTLGEWFNM
jgi:hypothetical protein